MSRARRVGSARLASILAQLSERDVAVLLSVRSYRLMNTKQLQRLLFHGHASEPTARRTCRRVLHRLHEVGLLRHLERRIGGVRAGSSGLVYSITPLGHRLLGTDIRRRWREPTAMFVNHTLAIAELGSLVVQLALNEGHEVLAIEPEPEAWRIFHDGLVETTLKPDLALRLLTATTEHSWFIEVDLDTESRPVIRRKCQTYTAYWRSGIEQQRHEVFPRVLWVCPTEKRARQIASTFNHSGVEPRVFAVVTADRAPQVLTSQQAIK